MSEGVSRSGPLGCDLVESVDEVVVRAASGGVEKSVCKTLLGE